MAAAVQREKQHQLNYKKILGDLLLQFREASGAETISMHWVNEQRKVLVLENFSSRLSNVVFKDRVEMAGHVLGRFSNLQDILVLDVQRDIEPGQLDHYTSGHPVRYVVVVPFVYNTQTVALLAADFSRVPALDEAGYRLYASWQMILNRLLETYLELSELIEKQQEWILYDSVADRFEEPTGVLQAADILLQALQEIAGNGAGVIMLARILDQWQVVFTSAQSENPPPSGLLVEEHSVASSSLLSGEAVFQTHFNASPKRISSVEPLCNGATLAVPLMHRQRRQMMVLVHHENALRFNEIINYKIKNLCRIASLKTQALLPDLPVHRDVFTSRLGALDKEVFTHALQLNINRKNGQSDDQRGFAAIAGIGNLGSLRTRYRVNELVGLQEQVLRAIRPQEFGLSGLVAEYADFVYLMLLPDAGIPSMDHYLRQLEERFSTAFSVESNEDLVQLHVGYMQLGGGQDAPAVIHQVKASLNQAMKTQVFSKLIP